jgi:hypothetical protein
MRAFGVAAGLIAMLSLCSGCSFLFVNEVPDDHANKRYFDCTSEELAPGLDTTGAVIYGVEGLYFAANDEYSDGAGVAAVALGMAALLGASAWYGFDNANSCEDAKAALERRVNVLYDTAVLGCTSDVQCEGERVCVESECVMPAAPPPVWSPLPASAEGSPVAPAGPPAAPPPSAAPAVPQDSPVAPAELPPAPPPLPASPAPAGG